MKFAIENERWKWSRCDHSARAKRAERSPSAQVASTRAAARGAISSTKAFSLLEIMIAVSIFFMAVFAILGLMSRSLAQARGLQPMRVDPSSVAAELSLTNRLEEGPIPPEIIEHFQHMYPNYTCDGTITEVGTNGLFQVDLVVGGVNAGKRVIQSNSRILLWRPMSQTGPQRTMTRPALR